jgi:hypothetical protein
MLMSLASNNLDVYARTVAALSEGGADDLKTALAWTLRNRLTALGPVGASYSEEACLDVLREATGRKNSALPPAPMTPHPDWCRSLAINCLVWSGDLEDPTDGATSCHRHDIKPLWAGRRVATALIGPYIFLR